MQYFRLENMKYRPKTPHTAEDTPPAIALFYQSYLEWLKNRDASVIHLFYHGKVGASDTRERGGHNSGCCFDEEPV